MLSKKKSSAAIPLSLAEDFSDIFTVIAGLAELAAANPHVRDDARLARYLEEIRKSGLHGSELLHHLETEDSPAVRKTGRRPTT